MNERDWNFKKCEFRNLQLSLCFYPTQRMTRGHIVPLQAELRYGSERLLHAMNSNLHKQRKITNVDFGGKIGGCVFFASHYLLEELLVPA